MPFIPSLRDFYEAPENMNRTLFATAHDEAQVDTVVAATQNVVGDLDKGEAGLLLVLPVLRVYGMERISRAKPKGVKYIPPLPNFHLFNPIQHIIKN